MLCSLGRHEPGPASVWNDGFYFGQCRHCACELIRKRRAWREVPRGYRVVWKDRTEADIDWSPLHPASTAIFRGFH
jgi:hypothetical protein